MVKKTDKKQEKEESKEKEMIYVLYGQPGSGKTTLGKYLEEYLRHLPTRGCDAVMIDGDELRTLFTNANYTKKGRYQNIRNANAIATAIEKTLPNGSKNIKKIMFKTTMGKAISVEQVKKQNE